MTATSGVRRVSSMVFATAATLATSVGTAAANGNHPNHTDEGSGIPWFPIVVGGLLLLMVGIMVVRRMIGDEDDDDGDAPDDPTDDE